MAAKKGCDGIEPDNIDAYNINTADPQGSPITKFRVTENNEVAYLTWLANAAHKYGLSIGLKNAADLAPTLVGLFDWALSEECNGYSDFSKKQWSDGLFACDYLNLFVKAGKAAFVAEYSDFRSSYPSKFFPKKLCADNNAHGFSTAEYNRELTGVSSPAANCLAHMPKSCAQKSWKECVLPKVYQTYAIKGAGMADFDMIGQCARARASQFCAYV